MMDPTLFIQRNTAIVAPPFGLTMVAVGTKVSPGR